MSRYAIPADLVALLAKPQSGIEPVCDKDGSCKPDCSMCHKCSELLLETERHAKEGK